jgi:Mce-associated membrane protein
VSTPKPPRRRIAGEPKPGAPTRKPVVKKGAKPRPTAKTKPPKTSKPKTTAPKTTAPKTTAPKTATPEVPSRPAASESAPAAADSRRRRFRLQPVSRRLGALVALTVAAVAFGAVFGIKGFIDWRNDSGIVEAHEKAATTAASAGETIFTYQFNQLPKHLEDAKATMTPSFAKKFESIAPALQELAPQRKIQVKATVRNAAAIECGDKCRADRATVLVFIDQARVAADAEKPTVFGNRIKLMMVERDGRWLVDNIDAL